MLSTKGEPAVAVYPDSDKIGVWPGDNRDKIMVRRESVVDYWDRETKKLSRAPRPDRGSAAAVVMS